MIRVLVLLGLGHLLVSLSNGPEADIRCCHLDSFGDLVRLASIPSRISVHCGGDAVVEIRGVEARGDRGILSRPA